MKKLMWIGVLLLVATPFAGATSITFYLNVNGCTGGCGTPPFGEITLTQNGASVGVHEELYGTNKFVKTGAGDALEFNITGNPAITISGITSGFVVGPAPDSASTFGSFMYSVSCSGCGNGASAPLPGPLDFTVSLTGGGTLSINSFSANSSGYYFTSDIVGATGATGNVGSNTTPSTVPEPTSLLLIGTGLTGLFIWTRKKR